MSNYLITSLLEFINNDKLNKIVYHGSFNDDIIKFRAKSNNVKSIPNSIFFSSKKSVAKNYGPNIYKCKLKCDNVIYFECNGRSFHDMSDFEYNIQNSYDDGYDCVVFTNIMDSKEPYEFVPLSDVYVIFDNNKVDILDIKKL